MRRRNKIDARISADRKRMQQQQQSFGECDDDSSERSVDTIGTAGTVGTAGTTQTEFLSSVQLPCRTFRAPSFVSTNKINRRAYQDEVDKEVMQLAMTSHAYSTRRARSAMQSYAFWSQLETNFDSDVEEVRVSVRQGSPLLNRSIGKKSAKKEKSRRRRRRNKRNDVSKSIGDMEPRTINENIVVRVLDEESKTDKTEKQTNRKIAKERLSTRKAPPQESPKSVLTESYIAADDKSAEEDDPFDNILYLCGKIDNLLEFDPCLSIRENASKKQDNQCNSSENITSTKKKLNNKGSTSYGKGYVAL